MVCMISILSLVSNSAIIIIICSSKNISNSNGINSRRGIFKQTKNKCQKRSRKLIWQLYMSHTDFSQVEIIILSPFSVIYLYSWGRPQNVFSQWLKFGSCPTFFLFGVKYVTLSSVKLRSVSFLFGNNKSKAHHWTSGHRNSFKNLERWSHNIRYLTIYLELIKSQSSLLFTHSWRDNIWIHTFPKCISAMRNAVSPIIWTRAQDSNHYTTALFLSFFLSLSLSLYIYIYIYIKHSGQFWQIHLPIPTWNQDTYQETWKDLKVILTKCAIII